MEISEPFVLYAPKKRQETGDDFMRYSRPIHAPTVALVSAAVYAGLAVLFVPVLSFLFLLTTGNAATETGSSETWMTMAVLAPVLCGLIGLVSGLLMASLFNLFVKQQVKTKRISEVDSAIAVMSMGDAA
jgi:hypothetical protein